MTLEDLKDLAPDVTLGDMLNMLGIGQNDFAQIIFAFIGDGDCSPEAAWNVSSVAAIIGYLYAKAEIARTS